MRNGNGIVREIRFVLLMMMCGAAASLAMQAVSLGQATQVTYTIDPTQSVLSASGIYLGETLKTVLIQNTDNPTVYSGFVASYGGNITAERDITADTIAITGGNIAAQDNLILDGLPVTNAPTAKNYFVYLNSFPPEVNDALFDGAIANFSFSISSSTINLPANFDISQLTSDITSGQFYAELETVFPSSYGSYTSDFVTPVGGELEFAPGACSLVDSGDLETLTLPINTNLVIQANGDPLDLNLVGSIVATAPIPEPASVGFVAFGVLILAHRPRR